MGHTSSKTCVWEIEVSPVRQGGRQTSGRRGVRAGLYLDRGLRTGRGQGKGSVALIIPVRGEGLN